jgi:hypothetical protein
LILNTQAKRYGEISHVETIRQSETIPAPCGRKKRAMSKNDLLPTPTPEYYRTPLLQLPPAIPLRDYFAGQALAGFAFRGLDTTDTAAKLAYAYAEAMLAERERKTNAAD